MYFYCAYKISAELGVKRILLGSILIDCYQSIGGKVSSGNLRKVNQVPPKIFACINKPIDSEKDSLTGNVTSIINHYNQIKYFSMSKSKIYSICKIYFAKGNLNSVQSKIQILEKSNFVVCKRKSKYM